MRWMPERQVQLRSSRTTRRPRHEDLALTADVEQPSAEGQRDAESGGDERPGEAQRLGERPDRRPRRCRPGSCRSIRGTRAVPASDEGAARGGEEVAGAGEEVAEGVDDPLVGEDDRAASRRRATSTIARKVRTRPPDAMSRSTSCQAIGRAFRGPGRGGSAGSSGVLEPTGRGVTRAPLPSAGRASRAACRRATMSTIAPRYITAMRSARAMHLVEFGRDDEHGHPASRAPRRCARG